MRKFKYLIALLIVVACTATASAQAQYDKALGLRLGGGVGVTYVMPAWGNYVEVIGELRFGNNGYIAVGGLYELKYSFFDVEGMDWYFGGGAHVGLSDNNFGMGVDGIIGLEYVFNQAPLNIGIDWKPGFDIINSTNYFADAAISLRYVFN